jgi:O-antigen/teichoic acid export membrane protein
MRSIKVLLPSLIPRSFYQRFDESTVAKRLLKGAAWILFGTVFSRVSIAVSMILVARSIGVISFGELGLIQSTLGVAVLVAGSGLGAAGTRFVTRYNLIEPEKLGQIIGAIRLTTLLTVTAAILLFIWNAKEIAEGPLSAPHLSTSLVLSSVLMAASVARGIQLGCIAGFERFDLIARTNIVEGIATLLAAVSLAKLYGLNGALVGLTIGVLSAWLIGSAGLSGILKERNILVTCDHYAVNAKEIIKYSSPVLIASLLATSLLWYCMTMAVKNPSGYSELGYYNAAYQWHGPLILLPMILTSASIPTLIKEWENGDRRRFRCITLSVGSLTLCLALPPALVLALISPNIMAAYGSEFRDGWPILVLLALAAPFHALANIFSGALQGMNRPWSVLTINLIWGAALMTLSLQLIPIIGVKGLAVAFLVAYMMQSLAAFLLVLTGTSSK